MDESQLKFCLESIDNLLQSGFIEIFREIYNYQKEKMGRSFRFSASDVEACCKGIGENISIISQKIVGLDFHDPKLVRHLSNLDINYEAFFYSYPLTNEAVLPSVHVQIRGIELAMQSISTCILPIEDFKYTYNATDAEANKLRRYIKIGQMIRKGPGYDKSRIGQLEKLILGGRRAIEEYLGKGCVFNKDDSLRSAFYAIIAPSLEGKTQAAFAFKTLKPLYLNMSSNVSDTDETKLIYKNFTALTDKFAQLAHKDMEHLKQVNFVRDPNFSTNIYDHMTSGELDTRHRSTKFLCLGFIYTLIQDTRAKLSSGSDRNWMEFYATEPKNYTFRCMSLDDLICLNFKFGEFIIFIDEFFITEWSIFLRNLSRAFELPIIVTNTNTNITNLVGTLRLRSGRSDPEFAWCIVCVWLNSLDLSIFNELFPELERKMNYIIGRTPKDNERELIGKFFHGFVKNQLQHTRPGFACWIGESIQKFECQDEINLNRILEKIVGTLKDEIKSRKKSLSQLGNIGLFMNNVYLSSDKSKFGSLLYHRKAYLQDHFYYLLNPIDKEKLCFIAYPPDVSSFRDNPEENKDRPLQIKELNSLALKLWTVEYTYFKPEEILPIFACQSIVYNESFYSALSEGTTGYTENTEQKVPLNGNFLEVLATASIIEASQHEFGAENSTFTGQDGETFLVNLIENMCMSRNFNRQGKVNLTLHESTIKNLIKKIHVPFLFPAGLELPPFFKDNLSNTLGFDEGRSVNFGKYQRTADQEEIKGIFDYYIKGTSTKPGICAVECKNQEKDIPLSIVRSILTKAAGNKADLSLIICNSVADASCKSFSAFKSKCTTKRWNVFKLYLNPKTNDPDLKDLILDRYFPELPFFSDYAMTCIILELFVINSPKELSLYNLI